jgi:hypothetical protein
LGKVQDPGFFTPGEWHYHRVIVIHQGIPTVTDDVEPPGKSINQTVARLADAVIPSDTINFSMAQIPYQYKKGGGYNGENTPIFAFISKNPLLLKYG